MHYLKLIFNILLISYVCCFQLDLYAQDTFYFIDSEGDLYSKEELDCAPIFVGPTDNVLETIIDITFDYDTDILYGVSISGDLLEINIETGFTSYLEFWYIPSISSLAYNNGKLYFDGREDPSATTSILHTYNTSTGEIIELGEFDEYKGAGDLAFCGNDLYFTTTSNRLLKVNIDNPSASIDLGYTGFFESWGLMAFELECANELLITSGNDLLKINTETMESELICADFIDLEIYGMTATRNSTASIGNLSLSHGMNEDILIMPNPVIDYAQLNLPFGNGQVEIFTINGLSVIKENVFDQQLTLNLSSLPTGSYIIKQTHDLGVTFGKVIKL
ncbi:MAG: hypothetical protein ACI8ZM_003721 [Crocinitomix sp.]|jgi:hypothetical protein